MLAQLRTKMFDDVDDPLMIDRCLFVIKELKLEADKLGNKDKNIIADA
jgi:hypothetical protein